MIRIGERFEHPIHGWCEVVNLHPRRDGRTCVVAKAEQSDTTVHIVVRDDEPFGMKIERPLYILDSRDVVGNCAVWWRPNGEGYTCNVDEAGVFDKPPDKLRPTDFVVPKELVDRHTVKHVHMGALRGEGEVADQFRALRSRALGELQREVDCPNCGDCGFVACGDPECFTCATDNEPGCPNSKPCPKCNPNGERCR